MKCRVCNSENVHRFAGELTASSPRIENVRTEPVYVCQDVLVCVDCGFAELIIPAKELGKLRRTIAAIGL
jgi:hypothetical protein